MELNDLFESTVMEEVASGFGFTEGPVWHPDGYFLFSDIPGNTIYRWQPGGEPKAWRTPSHQSNGLTYDRSGHLIACEHGARRVTRTEGDATITILASHYGDKRLNSPNDVVVRSDGSIYFTDPPYGVQPEDAELPYSGVFCLAPDGRLNLLVDDFVRPNGLAFSPDEGTLYIDDTMERTIRAFDVSRDGSLSNGRLFADLSSDMEGGPDGMKVDVEGNIYCTGPSALWVYQPDGALVGLVTGPYQPANVAFGGPDGRTLFLTATTSVFTLRTKIPGVAVF